MRDVRVGRVGEAVVTIDLLYEEGADGKFPPVVRNVQLERVASSASPRAFYIRGFPGAVVERIRVSDSTFNNLTEPEVVEHAGAISLVNVTFSPKTKPKGLNSVPPPKQD
jgi:unsaturated rhamnogalacturonyl hydrolase